MYRTSQLKAGALLNKPHVYSQCCGLSRVLATILLLPHPNLTPIYSAIQKSTQIHIQFADPGNQPFIMNRLLIGGIR